MGIKIYKNEFTGEPEEARYEIRGIVTIHIDTIVDLDKTLVDGKMSLLDYIQENIDIAHPRPIHHLPKKVFEELGGSIEKIHSVSLKIIILMMLNLNGIRHI